MLQKVKPFHTMAGLWKCLPDDAVDEKGNLKKITEGKLETR